MNSRRRQKQSARPAVEVTAAAADIIEREPVPLDDAIVGFAKGAVRSPRASTIGGLDGMIGSAVFGWAYGPQFARRRVRVAMYVDGQMATETIANGLRREKIGVDRHDGFCGFVCAVPTEKFVPGAVVRIFAEGTELTTPPLVLGPDRFDGIFEPIARATASGWVRERVREPTRARLDMVIDGRPWRTVTADGLREELAAHGVADGRFGFAEPLPAACLDGDEHRIEFRHHASGAAIAPGVRRFRATFEGVLERLDQHGGAGWVLCREMPERPVRLDIAVNGERLTVVANRPRADVRSLHGAEACGFEFAIPDTVSRHHEVRVEIFVAGTANPAIPGPFQFTPLSRIIEQLEDFAASVDGDAATALPVGGERPYSPLREAIVPNLLAALRAHYGRPGPLALEFELDPSRFRVPAAAIDAVVDVVIPVYGGYDETIACIDAAIRAVNETPSEIIVVDDCGPDAKLRLALARYERDGKVIRLVNPTNRGFPASANAGLTLHPNRDAILLNADTLVPSGWIDRLRSAAYRSGNVGSVTPLSNRATICSYPLINTDNDLPGEIGWEALDRLCARVNGAVAVELPTAVGFCVYLKRAMLREVGLLNAERWRRGYGEENELCILAAARGWKHVLAADLFVVHHGAVSFGAADRKAQLETNLGTLNQLYPDYFPRVMQFLRDDPAAAARRAIDWARLHALSSRFVLFVSHQYGGGTAIHAEDMARRLAARDRHVLILEANADNRGTAIVRNLALGTSSVYALPREADTLLADLRACGVRHIHFHHIMGAARWAALPNELDCAYDVTIHDYSAFCPRIDLIDEDRRYCGEPAATVCERCIALSRPHPHLDAAFRDRGSLAEWIDLHGALLSGARRVFAPSRDAAARMERHLPGIRYEVQYHPEPAHGVAIRRPASASAARVAIIGAIGPNKGSDLLLACARDALRRDLPLQFVFFGYTDDEAPLRQLANVRITGEYARDDLPRLVAENPCDVALFASIWPETFCYALSDAYAAGLYPIALSFGALAERIEGTGVGTLLALDSTPAQINAAILAEVACAANWPETVAFGGEAVDILAEYYGLTD